MLKIIENKVVSKQNYNIPKILPNNLNRIKGNYGISTNDIAKSLKLNRNFVGKVADEKANFSGISVIKFIKHFNLPFNLIYSVNKEEDFFENFYSRYLCIFEINLNKEVDKAILIKELLKSVDDNLTCVINILKEIKDGTIKFTKEEKAHNYNNDLIKYKEIIESTDYDYSKYKYVAIAYEIIENKPVKRTINLQENLDIDLIRYLENKPFITYKNRTINLLIKDLVENSDHFVLPKEYSIKTNDEIVASNILKKNDCKEKRTNVEFTHIETINNITKLDILREYKKYSIKDMADKLCLSEDTYMAIEKGYLKISAQTMWKIELEFGILLESVLNIDEYYKKYCIE